MPRRKRKLSKTAAFEAKQKKIKQDLKQRNASRMVPLGTKLHLKQSKDWTFEFPEKGWQALLLEGQCIHRNAREQRCSERLSITLPYCHRHMQTDVQLAVHRTSLHLRATLERLPFLGLFACDRSRPLGAKSVFKKGDFIVSYVAEHSNLEEQLQRYLLENGKSAAPYTVDDTFDASLQRCLGSLANTCHKSSGIGPGLKPCRPNATLVILPGRGMYPLLVATRSIANSEEIFLDYGEPFKSLCMKVRHQTLPVDKYNALSLD